LGSRALRFFVTEADPFGQLQTARRDAAGVPGPWQTVLDVAALRKESGIPYELNTSWSWLEDACSPSEYNRCLLQLSHGGGDEVEIREFDVDRGEFVKDGFQVPKARTEFVWLNQDLVLVEQAATAGAPRTIAGFAGCRTAVASRTTSANRACGV
jgi:prolyl oligopeptidase